MKSVTSLIPAVVWVVLATVVVLTPASQAADIGSVADFALAKDRVVALRQLIPSTVDYYYCHCLHDLNTCQFDQIKLLTCQWYQRHRQTARLTELQTRYALLTYETNPEQSLRYLRDRLGLRFDHQKKTVGITPNIPTSLDQNLISREKLKRDSLGRWGNLENFESTALDWLASEQLNWSQRREMLQRLTRPDVPQVVKLIVDDLYAEHEPPFGSYLIQR
jgi:hypothetical protein